MVDTNSTTFSFTVCSDVSGEMVTHDVTIPSDSKAKTDSPCAFSGLAHAAIGGADAPLLARAIAFILALGFTAVILPRLSSAHYLRPPLQGPPITL